MTRAAHLDGVRALAIGGVVLCHVDAPGCAILGTLGVQAFFMLSGYLITGLLRAPRERAYKAFLAARARRLAPALALMLAAGLLTGAVDPGPAALAALWAMNLGLLVGVAPGVIGHTWSLGLEAQFYLLWPLFARRLPPWGAVPLAAAALGLWVLWLVGPIPWRLINPAGMITGAALALRPVPWPDALRRALAWEPLATLGRLSYGVYLWHCPLLAALPHNLDWTARLAVALPLSTALAALSYLTVERWAGCAREPLWRLTPRLATA